MKKVLSVLAATAVLSVATGAMALTITNTKHDLSSGNSNAAASAYKSANTNQVCVFCHTPHNSAETRALWNRTNPSGTFSLYTSGANVEDTTWYVGGSKTALPSNSPSLLCLSCHDGATALGGAVKVKPIDAVTDAHLTSLTAGSSDLIGSTSGALLGTNLTNDHPISLVYETVRLAMTDKLRTVTNGKVNDMLPLAKNTNLECNTCHNVHDNANVPFLRMTNGGSALCLACHIK